ncbi:unnamed protein product [Urochloa humidicola]
MGRSKLQGIKEFEVEVTILHSLSHNHIVSLFGYCVQLPQEKHHQLHSNFYEKEKQERMIAYECMDNYMLANQLEGHTKQERMVVYEFMENRTLADQLEGQTTPPSPVTASWKMRIEILLGVSRAIEYLQSYAERPVMHRDMKSSNILLDASWAPRLTDFGLALAWEGPDHEDCVVGTMGYAAPEYVATGVLNPTIDVYGFGVVMLEVLTGKRAYFSKEEQEKQAKQHMLGPYSLAEFAVPLIKAGKLQKVLDRRPAAKPTPRQLKAVKLVAQVAVRCLKMDWRARPSISDVVATLQMALELARCDG